MKTFALITLCIASLLPTVVSAAEDEVRFGRLFMEPKTRHQLDESRKQNSSAQSLPAASEEIEEAAVTSLRVDGVVMRRDGSTEVWVNGVRNDSPLTVRRIGGNRFQVSVPGGSDVILKPGQVYSFESRRVLEGYEAVKELSSHQNPPETTVQDSAETPATKSEPAAAPPAQTAAPSGARASEFDEGELAEQDFRIKLEQGNDVQ